VVTFWRAAAKFALVGVTLVYAARGTVRAGSR
jgi:hypothetical protein